MAEKRCISTSRAEDADDTDHHHSYPHCNTPLCCFFSDAECAALNWAEAVNGVPHRAPSDADLEQIRRHYSDAEIAELTFAVAAIRAWNMLTASFHTPVPETPYVAG